VTGAQDCRVEDGGDLFSQLQHSVFTALALHYDVDGGKG